MYGDDKTKKARKIGLSLHVPGEMREKPDFPGFRRRSAPPGARKNRT
jgi:hypothetical protein